MIGPYTSGGLKMPHIKSFCKALKMTWINKILDPLNMFPWKTLLINQYTKYGADKIWTISTYAIVEYLLNSINSGKMFLITGQHCLRIGKMPQKTP